MGTNHGGNGGDTPPDGDRPPDPELPELPELPPELRDLAVPDDLSGLGEETERIRQEIAEERRTGRARSQPPEPARDTGSPLGTPLVVMSLAVLITLVSLFAMAWTGGGPRDSAGGDSAPSELPPITLTDPGGRQIALTSQPPMALLLVEECDCQSLVAATVTGAPSGVRVVAVGHTPPPVPAGLSTGDRAPLRLGDPTGLVRAQLRLDPPTDTATVVLIDRDGQIVRTHPAVTSVAQFQGDLTDLSR